MDSIFIAPALLVIALPLALSIEFPNTVIGNPSIDCFVDNVKMTVETTQGNPSHMFVKGRHHEQRCISRNTNILTIQHEECGLQRERSLNPPGVYYRVCIVIQMHPQFVTKVDKTFCASCFYMESVKELTQELGISKLPSTEVAISFPMPQCTYTIRRGSPTGPEIRFATVGEPVYHVWTCPSEAYGMLVQNCYVDDGQGNRILIIDQNGCGVDRYIIQTPNYNDELTMSFQESHVFKFADKTITRFTCQIKVCIKPGGSCDGITPPANCPALGQGQASFKQPHFDARFRNVRAARDTERRSILRRSNTTLPPAYQSPDDEYIDVSGELFILEEIGNGADRQIYEDLLNNLATGSFKQPLRPANAICVPTMGFVLMLMLFSILLIIALSVTTVLLWRGRSKTTSSSSSSHSSKDARKK